MTRIKLELTAVDDYAASRLMLTLAGMIVEDQQKTPMHADKLAPQYSIGDTIGSVVCDVIREDNSIERGMEVTL